MWQPFTCLVVDTIHPFFKLWESFCESWVYLPPKIWEMFRICAQAREVLCDFYIREGLFVPCPVGMGGLSYQMYTKQHLVTLKEIFVTNLVLSTKSGKVIKIASLSRILLYFFQVFNDVHMLMCTLGAKNEDATLKLLASLREFVRYILSFSFSCLS